MSKRHVIPIKLSNPVMSMASWTKRQGEVTSHSRSYGEELQRSIFVQIASAIGDLESAIGITALALVMLLSGCSMMESGTPAIAPATTHHKNTRSFSSFSELDCQPLPIPSGKKTFNVPIGSTTDRINLPSGESPVLAYSLPTGGIHQITLFSSVVRSDKGDEEIFFPEVSLLDKNGQVLRTLSAEQVKYQQPGFITEEGISTTFNLNNYTQNPASCMAIYTSDQARKGTTKLINEAKAYAKARGTVPLPYRDTYAKHGNKGQLSITLKSNPEYSQLSATAINVSVNTSSPVLTDSDPFTQKLKKHYLKEVSESLKAGSLTQALDMRSELKNVIKATEGYFASQYQRNSGDVQLPPVIKNNERVAAQAVKHYQEKIARYLKQGKGALALQVVDEVRETQEDIDKLFDRKL